MDNIIEALKPLSIPIDSVKLDDRNARQHPPANLEAIKRSIEHYGQRKPIVIRQDNMSIEAGNGLWMAAKDLGWTRIAAVMVEDDPVDATGYAIMDNQSALLADWDFPVLKDLLEELDTGAFNMDLTGFSEDAIADLMSQFHEPGEGNIGDDEVPEPTESRSSRGDLWSLGNHRLLCGDATMKADIERLMGDRKADMVLTDPPYGIGIVKHSRMRQLGGKPSGVIGGKGLVEPRLYRPVIGDDTPFNPRNVLKLAPVVILFGANHYSSKLPDVAGWLVWDKGISPDSTFSACELLWTNVGNHIRRYEYRWSGMIRKGNREEELTDRVHPTQKPVGLIVQILEDYVSKCILDTYGGSGSTLIACEKLDRSCFMMEIDPHYCDVIIERWEQFTGQKAEKIG